jgi:hypothetical protein
MNAMNDVIALLLALVAGAAAYVVIDRAYHWANEELARREREEQEERRGR